MWKGLIAGAVNLALALGQNAPFPAPFVALAAGLVGFAGYGVSIMLFVLALRRLGTARTGAYFSTAPFIGLFGTVWGIYHALAAVSAAGTIQIDKVAGPVGEALIMTAIGLVVAIPAVLGYNAFTRVNRITLAELDAFAHDLHAHLTTGTRVTTRRSA